MPTWMKRGASESEGGPRKQRAVNKTDIMEDLVIALGEAHLLSEREVRENSSCAKTTVLFYRDEVGNFPDWAQEGATEFGLWLKEVDDRVGEDVGSPHVRVGVKSLLALINSPQLKDIKLQARKEQLVAWWKNKIEKEEKSAETEIVIFRVSTPPPKNKGGKEEDVDMEEGRREFLKVVFVLADKTAQENLKDIMKEIGGDIKNGPAPRSKATKRVQQLLRQAKLRGK